MNFWFDYTDNCNTLELRINKSLNIDDGAGGVPLSTIDASLIDSVSLIRADSSGINTIDITALCVLGSQFVFDVSIAAPEPKAGIYKYTLIIEFTSTYQQQRYVEKNIVMYCELYCCVANLLIELSAYKRDCFDPKVVINVLRRWGDLMALIDAAACGNIEGAKKLINELTEFCNSNECHELIKNCY